MALSSLSTFDSMVEGEKIFLWTVDVLILSSFLTETTKRNAIFSPFSQGEKEDESCRVESDDETRG
jgi:hypothetical protein